MTNIRQSLRLDIIKVGERTNGDNDKAIDINHPTGWTETTIKVLISFPEFPESYHKTFLGE